MIKQWLIEKVEREFTTNNLVKWLSTQPPETRFEFMSNEDCLYCRFAKHLGIIEPRAGGDYWRADPDDLKLRPVPLGVYNAANCCSGTYGEALKIAKRGDAPL